MRAFILLCLLFVAAAQDPYAQYSYCGWGGQTYRAVGDWDWSPAGSTGVMRATNAQPCEYSVTIRGLNPNQSYKWKVTIGGTWEVNWGCYGRSGGDCYFTPDSTGSIYLKIVARDAYVLTASAPPAATSSTTKAAVTSSTTKAAVVAVTTSTTKAATVAASTSPVTSTNGKYVFAHYMMGFAYGSDYNFFVSAIKDAIQANIDAFAVNVGTDEWQPDRFDTFLSAARDNNFKLFLSFDMNHIKNDFWRLNNWINRFWNHPAYFRYNNRPYVSTFAGHDKSYDGAYGNDAWQKWKNEHGGKNLYFCPSFFGDLPNFINTYSSIDCLFNWDSWGKESSNNRDGLAITAARNKGKQFMSGVAPWFYCHLPIHDKNWFWPQGTDTGDDNLYPLRWKQAIDAGSNFVEIVTWNDYSESSYIAPLSYGTKTELNAESKPFVENLEHIGWLKMTAYYAKWFKTGDSSVTGRNRVYYSYRPHAKDQPRSDVNPPPQRFWNPNDCVAIHSISSYTGATVTVTVGGQTAGSRTISSSRESWCNDFSGKTGAVKVTVNYNGQITTSQGVDIQASGNIYIFNEYSGYIEY